jgi:3-oxoacid CoA-transferase
MEQSYLKGKSELELIPQGTLAEKVRCAAVGIPAFYSVTGLHTLYGDGKLPVKYNEDGSVAKYNQKRETREFGGKTYMLEEAFEQADWAWIKAEKADKMGNCVFKGTGYNFNGIMARISFPLFPSPLAPSHK